MPVSQVDVTIEAKGSAKSPSAIADGVKVQTKGKRWAIVLPEAAAELEKYDWTAFLADMKELASHFSDKFTPARIAELFDSNVVNVRLYQDAGRNGMHDTGAALSQDELDVLSVERATASGRGGARGPRLSDQEVIDAAHGLALSDARFKQLDDLVDNTPVKKLGEVVTQLRAAYTAAGLDVPQVKQFAVAGRAKAA